MTLIGYKTIITIDIDTREWHMLQRVFFALEKMKYRVFSIKRSSIKGYHIKAAHKIKKTFKQIMKDRTKAFDDPLRIKYDLVRRIQGLPTQVLFKKKIKITKKIKKQILDSIDAIKNKNIKTNIIGYTNKKILRSLPQWH